MDAFAAYHWKLGASRLTAQLNVKNILDKEYFLASEPINNGSDGHWITTVGVLSIEIV